MKHAYLTLIAVAVLINVPALAQTAKVAVLHLEDGRTIRFSGSVSSLTFIAADSSTLIGAWSKLGAEVVVAIAEARSLDVRHATLVLADTVMTIGMDSIVIHHRPWRWIEARVEPVLACTEIVSGGDRRRLNSASVGRVKIPSRGRPEYLNLQCSDTLLTLSVARTIDSSIDFNGISTAVSLTLRNVEEMGAQLEDSLVDFARGLGATWKAAMSFERAISSGEPYSVALNDSIQSYIREAAVETYEYATGSEFVLTGRAHRPSGISFGKMTEASLDLGIDSTPRSGLELNVYQQGTETYVHVINTAPRHVNIRPYGSNNIVRLGPSRPILGGSLATLFDTRNWAPEATFKLQGFVLESVGFSTCPTKTSFRDPFDIPFRLDALSRTVESLFLSGLERITLSLIEFPKSDKALLELAQALLDGAEVGDAVRNGNIAEGLYAIAKIYIQHPENVQRIFRNHGIFITLEQAETIAGGLLEEILFGFDFATLVLNLSAYDEYSSFIVSETEQTTMPPQVVLIAPTQSEIPSSSVVPVNISVKAPSGLDSAVLILDGSILQHLVFPSKPQDSNVTFSLDTRGLVGAHAILVHAYSGRIYTPTGRMVVIATTAELPVTGLISYFPFEGHDPGHDMGTLGNHGTLIGGVTRTSDRHNASDAALLFNGRDGAVSISGAWGGSPEITVSAWCRVDHLQGGFQAIVESLTSTGDNSCVHLQMNTPGVDINNVVYTDRGPILLPIITPTPLGTWRMIAVTSRSGSIQIYVDGQPLGLMSSFTFNVVTRSVTMNIGRGCCGPGNGPGRYFDGAIDDVRVYNRALTAAEVRALYDVEK